MVYLLSYQSGIVGHGLPKDLDRAMEEAEERCAGMEQNARILNHATYAVVAEVRWTPDGYKAIKLE